MRIAGYDELRAEQGRRERRAAGDTSEPLMGIGISFFTEGVGAGPRKHMDILGLGMADGCRAARAPDRQGTAPAVSCRSQGQGHETTFAQIVAQELGIPPEDIEVHPRRHRQHPVRPRHVRVALDAVSAVAPRRSWPGESATRPASSPPRRSSARPTISNGSSAAGRSRATRRRARRSRRSPCCRTARSNCPTASRATSTARASTTRRT